MWMFWLLGSIVAFHSLSCTHSHLCPKKCVCEHTKSVQCFRIQAVPSGLSLDVRKLNLAYNHIKEIKVLLSIYIQLQAVLKLLSEYRYALLLCVVFKYLKHEKL